MKKRNDESFEQENYGPRPIILWVLVIILLVVLYFLLHSSLFNVSNITVYGAERFSRQEIVDASGITFDMNIIKVNEDAAKEGIEQNPYLIVENIRRVFPTGIEIYVAERTPVAQIGTVNGYYIIDKNCTALGLIGAPDEMIASVTGVGITEPVLGNTVQAENEEKISALAKVLAAMDKYSLNEKITEINISDPEKIVLTYQKTITVQIAGGATADTKLRKLDATVAAVADKLTEGRVLHMESEDGYYIK